jgi:ferritin-like metal-binding protein YciE
MHAYSYEHMELAAYELLRRVADRAGNSRVSELATRIGAEERAMADRVEDRWESATRASLRDKGAENLREELVKYLRDAHALEAQGMQRSRPARGSRACQRWRRSSPTPRSPSTWRPKR